MQTLRDGLLRATPATSDVMQSASVPSVEMRNIGPFSLFLSDASGVSSSCRIGLEGSGASLLGTGVTEGGGLENDLFDNVGVGVCFAGVV